MKYIIFDTETGGLDAATDALVSLGAVVWENGKRTDREFYTLVNDTEGLRHARAMEVNGIKPEQLEVAPKPHQTWASFVAFCQTEFGRNLVLLGGHNTGFDVSYLKRLARLSGNAARFEAIFSHRTVCTMNICRFLSLTTLAPDGLGSLGQCVEAFGIEKQQAHNALGDARMAADLLTKLIDVVNEDSEVRAKRLYQKAGA